MNFKYSTRQHSIIQKKYFIFFFVEIHIQISATMEMSILILNINAKRIILLSLALLETYIEKAFMWHGNHELKPNSIKNSN